MASILDIKEPTYKWIGILSIVLALILVAFGIDMIRTQQDAVSGILSLSCCVPFCIVIGTFFVYIGLRAEREKKEFEKLAGYIGAYRRIKIPLLAQKMKLSEFETERRIIRCVRMRLLTGYIDRASDEFFNPQGAAGKVLLACPHCGGSVEQMIMEGETGKCPYCGSLMIGAK